MMELMLFSFFAWNISTFMAVTALVLVIFIFKISIWTHSMEMGTLNFFYLQNSISDSLVILTLIISMLVIVSKFNYFLMSFKLIWLNLLVLFCWFSFYVDSVLNFYLFFEMSLIPIFVMILGWGYQPERLNASMMMMIYTISGSLPFLFVVLMLYFKMGMFYFSSVDMICLSSKLFLMKNLIAIMAVLGFLIKVPMFFFHLWLPKAHVEASVSGSMFLAAILLKLGGYGIFRVLFIMKSVSNFQEKIMTISLIGGMLMSMLCLSQLDMKVLIAYSSVAHMSMVIYSMMAGSLLGVWAAMSMMLAHGISSSGLFFAADVMYNRSGSRILLMNKSILNFLPIFCLFFFILSLANMGAPPTFNLMSEIINFLLILNMNISSSVVMFFMGVLSVGYTLILYSSTQQGQHTNKTFNIFFMNQMEMISLWCHSMWTFLPVLFITFFLL